MYKKLFYVFVFVTTTLTLTQFTTADYRITNGNATEPAWAVYSMWRSADNNWPEGWRTQGWYKIEPNATINLPVPQSNTWVYIRLIGSDGKEIRPSDHATRDSFPFWIHSSEIFIAVETNAGDLLKSNLGSRGLKQETLYEYRNGGSHTLAGKTRLPYRLAQEIYDEAIDSVVWIETNQGNGIGSKGSGVLIDKERFLVVTNEHVIRNAEQIVVFFPWRDENGYLNKDSDFYVTNKGWLERQGYVNSGRVIVKNVRDDLAIIQLASIPTTAREIKHDFSKNIEDSMREGDKVHILGNPGNRLWDWTEGTFLTPREICLPSNGACLVMSGDAEGGNSGGPVLNDQGMLIGILTAATDETLAVATPARNVKALLDTVPVNLVALPAPRTYPKRVFKIRNNTGVPVPYQIRWSNSHDWQPYFLETGFISTHWSNGQNVPSSYPRIRFDYIADDQLVTYRSHTLETAQFHENNDNAPTYFFQYNQRENRLDLFQNAAAAPALSKAIPKETVLLSNYPNPFNPETWIPYKLSKPAEVTVRIYAADGRLIRKLALGHQPAGVYQSKSRAAYWDGKSELGETIASGVYFYTLKAGEFTATRKMLIRK